MRAVLRQRGKIRAVRGHRPPPGPGRSRPAARAAVACTSPSRSARRGAAIAALFSRTIAQSRELIEPYVRCLVREIEATAALIERLGLRLETAYIGGGTPTAISAAQLRLLMDTVRRCFDVRALREYTVEAGRPDCTDEEKLGVILEGGATRISINPQTMDDGVPGRHRAAPHGAGRGRLLRRGAAHRSIATSTWT